MADQPQGESSNQLIVALAIVGVLGLIGMGLIIAGVIEKSVTVTAIGFVGTIIGALGNALAAPSGISSVIKAAKPNEPTP